MSQITVEVALRHLLDLRADAPEIVCGMVRAAAGFVDALDAAGGAVQLRQRAWRLREETAEGTPYDACRTRFAGLFRGEEDLPFPPPCEDFGDLHDEHRGYLDYPTALRSLIDQTLDYKQSVPLLEALKQYQPADVGWPAIAGTPTEQEDEPLAEGTNPVVIAEAWLAQLHRLDLLAEQEHCWGSHLMFLCWTARNPTQGDLAAGSWLHAGLTRQAGAALAAIQRAAAATRLAPDQVAAAPLDQPACWHSEDYRAVVWFGTAYTFSEMQALAVGCLWRAWERGWPGVSQRDLLLGCGSDGSEIRGVLGNCAAWQTMIRSSGKGMYRLQPPDQK